MEIEKAFKRLLIKEPFYGLFCMSLPKVITTKVSTLCVTKQGLNCQLNINPDFWSQHTDDEQIALLKHELSHICLQHIFLHESFADKKYFNIAADAEVNSYIDNLPKDAVTALRLSQMLGISVSNGLGTKAYYDLLVNPQTQQKAKANNPQKPCNGGKGGNEDNSSQNNQEDKQQAPQSSSSPSEADNNDSPDNSSSEDQNAASEPQMQPGKEPEKEYPDEYDNFNHIDSHDSWKTFKNMSEATRQLMTNNINTLLKNTAEQVEKMRGTIPGELHGIIEKLREKKPETFNWKAYFRRLLGSIYDVNIRSTRRKESKRFEGATGIQHKKKVSILVAIDTSGSVSIKELQEFFSEIDYVYKAGARVTIVECDTKINSITEYDGKKLPEIHGRGGTDFNPPVDYYVEHKKEYASLIYFTDGEAPMPYKEPSGMVWVISSRGRKSDSYPGKTIYIPKDNKSE